MDFHELYKARVPTGENILELIDEYSLYCYYLGFNVILSRSYPAPYRDDKTPSFTVFPVSRGLNDYLWRDQSTGEIGNIFELVKRIYGFTTRTEVLARISEDFGLGYEMTSTRKEKIITHTKPEHNEIKIQIQECPLTEKGKAYWDRLGVSKELLDLYHTTQYRYYWTYKGQPVPKDALDPSFAYRIGSYYQLYSPTGKKEDKFRNDLPPDYFFGYLQLPPRGKKLIIDKSCKDVIVCRRLGYNAVCGRSETTHIPERKILELRDRFEEIYLNLDPDQAGKAQTEKYMQRYPWMKPRFLTEAKDKSDLIVKLGLDQATPIIHRLNEC
jgi:hypothetical protein